MLLEIKKRKLEKIEVIKKKCNLLNKRVEVLLLAFSQMCEEKDAVLVYT